ncbi:tripartite tricarboxylate transporter substrate binding protein [Bosea sp. BK604]|uniref:Bug family tripartite tricarboxylate transporter substrate binding protein n=1 Tax=Bosea sp. BK604 TaxID=2512180 RepID=UPI0010EC3040|nr:tripartite tricarboxylate transporter substrate binding protein [Bosea sp. BK604]TCR66176.1 tripartite-type tricarboxylate transporter receptor subunit TctC [Bosea sp. BK604]
MIGRLALALLAQLAVLLPAAAQGPADSFPKQLIKIVVPYPPGGSTDPVARTVADELRARFGQSVIVENRPGAAGSIGTDAVAKADADGYTILFHTSVITVDPSFKKHLPYNVSKDLRPLAQVAIGPYLMVTHPSLPAKNVAEFIAYAKANPGKLNFGSAGQGSSGHLIGELFGLQTGIDMVHVPFRGGGPSIQALMGNEVQLLFDTVTASRALAEGGQIKALAVTSPERSPLMPTMPTMRESGMSQGFEQVYWLGFFVPAATPEPIVTKLSDAIIDIVRQPKIQDWMKLQGLVPRTLGPAEFKTVVERDIETWRNVIRDAKIEPQ